MSFSRDSEAFPAWLVVWLAIGFLAMIALSVLLVGYVRWQHGCWLIGGRWFVLECLAKAGPGLELIPPIGAVVLSSIATFFLCRKEGQDEHP